MGALMIMAPAHTAKGHFAQYKTMSKEGLASTTTG